MDDTTQYGPDDDGAALEPQPGPQRTSHIRRRRRPPWSAQEERLLVEKHAQLGNAWMEISEFLPGRTAGEVKNIYHSTLRASRDPGRSLLRSYCMQIHGRESDAKLRREALRSAVRAMAAQNAVASKTLRQTADGLHYGPPDDEPETEMAAATTMRLASALDVGAMDAMLASRDAGLAQLRLLAAMTGAGEDWESDDGSGRGGGGGERLPAQLDAGAGSAFHDRLPLLLGAGLGRGAAPTHTGAKRAAPSEAAAMPQGSDSTSSDRCEPADSGKRARVAVLPAGAHMGVGLEGRASGQASVALEGLLGAAVASLRDGNNRMQTLDLSGGGAAPEAATHGLLAQQLQALQQVQRAQQYQQQHQQQQQLREAQHGHEQMLRLPDAALLQLLRDEVQARSRAPADALPAMTDGAAPAAADGELGNKLGAAVAQVLNQDSTPATSAGAGSGPRNARGSHGGCASQDSGPTGPAAVPSSQQQNPKGARTAAAPRGPAEVTPLDGSTGTAATTAAATARAQVPAPVEASHQPARSEDRDSADTACDTAVGSGRGAAAVRGIAGPGTSAWEAEQRRRIDRLLSYGISLDEIEEELLRRRQAKLAAEAAALGEAAAALAAGRRDATSPAVTAPVQRANGALALPQGPTAGVGAEKERHLKLDEQQDLLQRLQALHPPPQQQESQLQPQLQVKADPDAPIALDTQMLLRRQLLLGLLKQPASRPQQPQSSQLQQQLPKQQQQQLQLGAEGMLQLNAYAPVGVGPRGLPGLTLQAAPALDLCGSLGMQLPLPLGVSRGAGDLDMWLRANRSGAPNMWS